MGTATAMTGLLRVDTRKESHDASASREQTLSDMFVAYLLARNSHYEGDLVDQLFNSSEKRLAVSFLCWLILERKEFLRPWFLELVRKP